MLLVYSHKITNRIKYIFDFVFKQNYGIDYEITTNRDEFIIYNGPRLNYSFEPISDVIHIQPSILLNQDNVQQQHIEITRYNNTAIFFSTNSGDLPFDIFSASFYLITRYEEYLKNRLDRFGRYSYLNSLAFQKGFLNEPVVNIWIGWLRDIIKQRYPQLKISESVYSFQPTIDVDNAYAYINKGFLRQTVGIVKSLIKDRVEFFRRIKVYWGKQNDPYNTYDYLNEINVRYNISPVYFFLLADYGGYDRGLSVNNAMFRNLIIRHAKRYTIGIHPSFMSNVYNSVFENELSSLSNIIGKDIFNSRFHYIKFILPDSYEKLIAANIVNDYSMGYPSKTGFRCGYAGDYLFFNLLNNQKTTLTIRPFQVMDTGLNRYMKLSPEEAIVQTQQIIDKIKTVNGKFTLLWHNESLCNIGVWKGWGNVYEQIVKYAV